MSLLAQITNERLDWLPSVFRDAEPTAVWYADGIGSSQYNLHLDSRKATQLGEAPYVQVHLQAIYADPGLDRMRYRGCSAEYRYKGRHTVISSYEDFLHVFTQDKRNNVTVCVLSGVQARGVILSMRDPWRIL